MVSLFLCGRLLLPSILTDLRTPLSCKKKTGVVIFIFIDIIIFLTYCVGVLYLPVGGSVVPWIAWHAWDGTFAGLPGPLGLAACSYEAGQWYRWDWATVRKADGRCLQADASGNVVLRQCDRTAGIPAFTMKVSVLSYETCLYKYAPTEICKGQQSA